MERNRIRRLFIFLIGVALLAPGLSSAGQLPQSLQTQLAQSKFVYIASQRKSGAFGKPAEIWFMYHDGSVWVASLPSSWRARRIRAGRTLAKIAVGKPDGPVFDAIGSFVKDPAMYKVLFETYAKKYPEGWKSYEAKFRKGLADGSRVLIRYTPK